jgi:hypothetical protein
LALPILASGFSKAGRVSRNASLRHIGSQDLDFTITNSEHLDPEYLVSIFKEGAQWVYQESGIRMPEDEFGLR